VTVADVVSITRSYYSYMHLMVMQQSGMYLRPAVHNVPVPVSRSRRRRNNSQSLSAILFVSGVEEETSTAAEFKPWGARSGPAGDVKSPLVRTPSRFGFVHPPQHKPKAINSRRWAVHNRFMQDARRTGVLGYSRCPAYRRVLPWQSLRAPRGRAESLRWTP